MEVIEITYNLTTVNNTVRNGRPYTYQIDVVTFLHTLTKKIGGCVLGWRYVANPWWYHEEWGWIHIR